VERFLNDFFDFAGNDFRSRTRFIGSHNAEGANPLVTGLEYDSRKIQAGNLYFALTGLHTDGHAFIDQALEKGASVIVHQKELPEYRKDVFYIQVKDSRFAMSPISASFYDFPSRDLTVIGVTGTEGKSTTVYLIWQLLKLAGKKAGFISTVQYCIAESEMWNPEHQTTPESPVIHQKLAEMRGNGLEFAVLEASSHGLSPRTNRLGDVDFDVGIMSNVTHEHLEFHGTWEQYRDDKANLFRALDFFSQKPRFGIVNADDKSADFFIAATKKPVFSYGIERGAVLIELIESGARGNSYLIKEKEEKTALEDNLPGAFNAKNATAALLCVAKLLDLPLRDLAPLVPRLKPVRGRMTALRKGQPFEVVVDYAHTPSSFETIFPPLRLRLNAENEKDGKKRKIISVFGSAGERDTQKRPEQGRIAALYSDILILTDEDPRGEEPIDIAREIALGAEKVRVFHENKDIFLIPDRPTAIRKAFSLANAGDLVLLLGKGHENSIIYKHETKKFDEISEAEQALAEIGYKKD
jgi:UDP-N-acetylmuramoyl-L-alanyl-D-glutamate--2,6-diaminopimelate ligase